MRLLSRFLSLMLLALTLSLVACGPGDSAAKADAAPVITTQPASASSTGVVATVFKVVATGGGLVYQWYRDGTAIADATQASYSTVTAGSYYVVVSNTIGKVTSSTATLTVTVDPVITVQPQSASVTAGKSAVLSVVATGAGLGYQWYRSGTVITGATASSYATSVAGTYTVVVSSSRTGAKSATSAVATVSLSASAVAPTITTQPVAQRVTAGNAVNFSVATTGTDLTYQWFKDGVAIALATSPGLALDPVTSVNAGNYYVVVTNSLGFVASNVVALSVGAVGNGSNTGAVVDAANVFLNTLAASQKALAGASGSATTVLFADTLDNARAWTSFAGGRHGLRLNTATLTVTQLNAADALISTALSTAGATLMSEIRLSDDVLAGINPLAGAGSALYSIAFIGQPSATQPWTLQLGGHQLTYNISYNTSLPSATPMFLGAEPPNWVFVSGGVYQINNTATSNGTPHAPMESQRQAVATLATALQGDAATAVSAKLPVTLSDLVWGPSLTGDTLYKAQAYPNGTTGRGVLYSALSAAQQAAVKAVLQAWAQTQAADVAEALLSVYVTDAALASTYVAYAPGNSGRADFSAYPNASALPGATANSYLRVDGPRAWIEFLVKGGTLNTDPVHYRSVWRDKLADYGGRY